MGQYKVPQDVEAEDKIVGNLTLKQFIYAVIGVSWALITFAVFRTAPPLFILIGIPPAMLMLTLGLYQRDDQPFEALFVALVSYVARPRKRVWVKEPVIEAFKVEPEPIMIEAERPNPEDVRGQLEKLSYVVDSRGWSAKRPELQEPDSERDISNEDRIVMPSIASAEDQELPEVSLSDDILDFKNNPNAQNLAVLIENTEKIVREEALDKMRQTQPESDARGPKKGSTDSSTTGMTANPIADILKIAMESDDLTVSQLAAQANRKMELAEGQEVSIRNGNTASKPQQAGQ